jgi:hypothetical protein
LALIVTEPFEAVTVTGNCDPAAAGALVAGLEAVLADVLADVLAALPQPASAVAATAAVTAAVTTGSAMCLSASGFVMWLPPERREGRRGRWRHRTRAKTDRPSHEGRFRRARQEATWLGPGRAVTVAGQRRNGLC